MNFDWFYTKHNLTYTYFSFMAIIDKELTEKAMSLGGYYETNQFTNIFGSWIHLITLVSFAAIIATIGEKHQVLSKVTYYILIIMSIIWTLNNIYSVILLW